MSELDPRKMALQIAGLRASETHLPEDERVFFDPYAEYFLTDEMRTGLENLDDIRAAISQCFKVTSASCKERYFKNASCDRPVSPMFNFVHATISTR